MSNQSAELGSSDSRCGILAGVDISCRLERVEGPLEVATLLLEDCRNLLLPISCLPETSLLLVQLDSTLQRCNGDCTIIRGWVNGLWSTREGVCATSQSGGVRSGLVFL